MKQEDSILQELINMGSPLAGVSRLMPYAVPAGYFESVAGTVGSVIDEVLLGDVTSEWRKEMPYEVPIGYFNDFADSVRRTIAVDNIGSLPKKLPQSVPAGYFDALPHKMLAVAKASDVKAPAVVEKEPSRGISKLISLRRRNGDSPIRWAAAAVFLMCIGLGSYETFYNRQQYSGPEKMLSSVASSDIEEYLQGTYRIDLDHVNASAGNINNLQVDSKDIVAYLNETGWDQTE